MAHPDTIENKRLSDAFKLIEEATADYRDRLAARLCLLEAVSCMRSGIPIDVYRETTGYKATESTDGKYAKTLLALIEDSGISLPLALASLARAELGEVETKKNGAVYTDFRLARYLAKKAMATYKGGPIIDSACGTSILLAACAEEWHSNGQDATQLVAAYIYGVDLSDAAIRGSILVLATFLHDASELAVLKTHFAVRDSLDLGMDASELFGVDGFSLIVGNPPWERVRPSRNEYARERGVVVDYGSEIENLPVGYELRQRESRERSMRLAKMYGLKGGMDLYRAFLTLSTMICSEGGSIALYLPAGLIRSKSLAQARDCIMHDFNHADISVFMNHAKFFSIDSRFKFVLAVLHDKTSASVAHDVSFSYCTADENGVLSTSELDLSADLFNDRSGELGAPEVKTEHEANVLQRIWSHGSRMKEHDIFCDAHPVRELDMTLDRELFESARSINAQHDGLPLIEGRMVSQYRCGCNEYVSGSGRSAQWRAVPPGVRKIAPQFSVARTKLDTGLARRSDNMRIGFCDIAGQTNERAMQAASIPSGCVCGNKVPTLLFRDEFDSLLWLGIVNSFTFDWVVRRYITTTINFFILENLPMPRISRDSSLACGIVEHVRRANSLVNDGAAFDSSDVWKYAYERAAVDALVFNAYELEPDDLETVLSDFPLVDQVNARVSGGIRPTIEMLRYHITGRDECREAAKLACERGAIPYLPNEHMRNLAREQ